MAVPINQGTGAFASQQYPASYAASLGLADLDGDGRVDLVVPSRVSATVSVLNGACLP